MYTGAGGGGVKGGDWNEENQMLIVISSEWQIYYDIRFHLFLLFYKFPTNRMYEFYTWKKDVNL